MTTNSEAVVYGDDANQAFVAWAHEGEINNGTVADFADYLATASAVGDNFPAYLYAAAASGKLIPVPFEVQTTPYNDEDIATATVLVHLGAGMTITASWTIDGRV